MIHKKNYLVLVLFFAAGVLSAQNDALLPVSLDHAAASEEFRRGVQSYYRGSYNEAIMLFEKALSHLPGEPQILDWLGKSYFSSGIEGAALEQWELAYKSGYGGILLKNKIEVLKERRNFIPDKTNSLKFVEAVTLEPLNGTTVLFKQPLSVCSADDGSFWVTAYGSNELLQFDVNGVILSKTKGPIEGFDRPFDVITMNNGSLLVSEFAADRVSMLTNTGKFKKYFGKKGLDGGGLLGPQFLAVDSYDNIYVTDFGNARVAVFDSNGNFLFNFGKKTASFPGFIAPSGIAIADGLIYVADSIKGAVYTFDTAGNYVRQLLPENSLKNIESMRVWKNNIIVSAGNKVYLLDIALSSFYEIAGLGNAPVKLTAAVPDANGDILIVDFKNETIEITSSISELAGGLFITIRKVYSEKFPDIILEVAVETRDRHGIVGLNQENFIVTEESRPVSDFEFKGSAYLNSSCDIALLLPRSPASEKEKQTLYGAIKEIASAMGGKGTIKIFSAGAVPAFEGTFLSDDLLTLPNRAKTPVSPVWKFDLGLRLAAGGLINGEMKRAVIFFSFTDLSSENFTQYSLNDLAAYMSNNSIRFYAINMKQGALPPEVVYLVKKTGGFSSYVYADKGLKVIIDDILKTASGVYKLSYRSALPTDFGRKFMPVEVEVRLLKRSGRDETGYFAPLE